MALGTTIDGLNTVASLTAQDEVPVWDKEASGEPTKKITASNLASSVKTLANLQGALTFDTQPKTTSTNPVTSAGIAVALNNKQNTLTFDTAPTDGSTNPVTSGGVYTAIQQSTAITETELGATGYTAQVTYNIKRAIKQNKRVTLQLSCVFNINIPTGTVIATIPEGYRPSANVYVPAILITDADAVLLTTVTVTSSGNITQGSTGYCRKVYVCADYAL